VLYMICPIEFFPKATSTPVKECVCEEEGPFVQIIIGLGGKGELGGVFQSGFQVKRAARERKRESELGLAGRPGCSGMPASLHNRTPLFSSIGIQERFSVKCEHQSSWTPYQTKHAEAIILLLTD
jgi:hypothetical protein